jgi:hypothetical protein
MALALFSVTPEFEQMQPRRSIIASLLDKGGGDLMDKTTILSLENDERVWSQGKAIAFISAATRCAA